jgi:lipopolysaccharide/colanic/teichoic acid biosynthesis glycosyltransferase
VAVVPEGWVPWPLLPARDWEAVDLVVKRVIDLVLGSVLLVLTSPLIAVSALLVKLTSPGPAFFLHTRKGRTEENIQVVKLRTMVEHAEEMHGEVASRSNGSVFETVEDDPRVTAVGAWLRKLSIDELPQLVNVLRGEMSLVGPRPLVEDEVRRLPIRHRWTRARFKPGLTCLWQISGRNACPDRRRLALDQRYVNEWNLWLDVKILLLTVPAVIFGRGAT